MPIKIFDDGSAIEVTPHVNGETADINAYVLQDGDPVLVHQSSDAVIMEDFESYSTGTHLGQHGYDATGDDEEEFVVTSESALDTDRSSTRGVTAADRRQTAKTGGVCERGWQYYNYIYALASDAGPFLLLFDQDASDPSNDCYAVRADIRDNDFEMREVGGPGFSDVSVSMSHETTYILSCEVTSDQVRAILYDNTFTELATTPWISTTLYSSGTFGWDSGRSDMYIDTLWREPL